MSSIRYLCLRTVLDIAQVDLSQDSRTVKLQKEEFKNCKAGPIERKVRLIKLRFLQILNHAWKLAKRLGFESNTARYKRKTLIHVSEVLWVTPMRFVRFCNLLSQQVFTEKKIQIHEPMEISYCIQDQLLLII